MTTEIDRCVNEVSLLRNQLLEVENKMKLVENKISPQIWQEFLDITHKLEQAEQKARQICQLKVGDINHVREKIITALNQFHDWRNKLKEVENLFLEYILRPGYRLKQAIRQREFLEYEYSRIKKAIQNGEFKDQGELETDIRRVLSQGDSSFDVEEEELEKDRNLEESLIDFYFEINAEDVEEAISKEELIHDFKRIVLPKIHPDTSNTSDDDFKTIFEAYQQGDFLLMEAYISEYRGEIQPDFEEDPLDNLQNLKKTEKRYQQVFGRLQRRLEKLKQDLTEHGVEEPEKILINMEKQRKNLLSKILEEAEKILQWRSKIEDLVKYYQESNPN